MMNNDFGDIVIRKLLATFVTFTIVSLGIALLTFIPSMPSNHLGKELLSLSFLFMLYVGLFVSVYGNAVSTLIEYTHKKWLNHNNWIYIFLHGLFGLASGVFFQIQLFYLYGLIAAVFYALIDRWIYLRDIKRKRLRYFLIVPILIYTVVWGVLQMISIL